MLEEQVDAISGDPSNEVKSSGSDTKQKTLVELKALRATTKRNLTRIKNLIDSKGDSLSTPELECRLGILESYFKQVLNLQTSIERFGITEDAEANDYFRSEVEDVYIGAKSKIMSLLNAMKDNTVSGDYLNTTLFHHQPVLRSKLEQIKLPTFSGKFSEYPNFIGLFKNLVDKDESLDSLQKLNYLKRSLTGAALGSIKEFDMIGANDRKALERLASRFDNKCLMFQEHINSLLEVPKVSKATSFSLRNLEDSFNTHLTAMLSIGNYKDITHAILISLALDRVDNETQVKWQDSINYSKLPSWEDFTTVLDRRCKNLEAKESKNYTSEKGTSINSRQENRFRGRNADRSMRSTTLAAHKVQCAFCNAEGHQADACLKFQDLPVASRFHETKRLMLCINCLEKGHSVRRCSKPKCSICYLPHHRLLHRFTPDSHDDSPSGSTHTERLSTLIGRTNNQVVLATALIEVRDNLGAYHPVRALLDSASQLNFITEHMAQRLRLKRFNADVEISGIGKEVSKIRHRTQAVCKSRISDFKTDLDLLVIKAITDLQPNKSFSIDNWNIPKNVVLADPQFNQASRIDMLIGAECFFELMAIGQIKVDGRPTLQKTLFGWVVSGKYDLSLVPNASVCLVGGQRLEDEMHLNEIVEKFWKLENIDCKGNFLSPEDKKCEEHFSKTVSRNEEGRFVVRLPFKENPVVLGHSFEIARRRFHALERRLEGKPEVKEQYGRFMQEYEDLGHMQVVPEDTISKIEYFCPHQCVLRPDSSTTKLRVVFDCSATTSSNISLNDVLMKGPVIQDTLFALILRFRCFRFALTADISKMYRQILVDKEDRKYQGILWRSKTSDKLKVYQLNTVTYGTTSAPFLATRCLKMLADNQMQTYPVGAKVLGEDFYMDDLISEGDSSEEIARIYHEVSAVLKSAGFELRKWWTNDEAFLSQIPDSDREVPLRINDSDVIKTLGIKWNPSTDQLQYMAPDIVRSKVVTKRKILSELSTLFDPLGLINPVIVKGKIILQSLWVHRTDWDESVQSRIHEDWKVYRSRLKELGNIRVPRFVLTPNYRKLEIHGFADASLKAYGCCVYIRTMDEKQRVTCSLLAAKSRVAPIKTQSLPKLELCAAEMLVTLLGTILPNLSHLFIDRIVLWTDSEIVLCWLSAHPSTWDVFIANRVSKIQSDQPTSCWRHVNSINNPADIISRGAYADELLESIWFKGPDFLYLPDKRWPKQKDFSVFGLETPGRRKSKTVLLTTNVSSEISEHYIRFRDFQKTCRIFGYVVKFITALKRAKMIKVEEGPRYDIFPDREQKNALPSLTVSELDEALMRIIWHIQREHFKDEIKLIEKNDLISPKSFVNNLNPFLDDSYLKLLRVGGRLQNADIPYSAKCPILLPKSHPFVFNLMLYFHRKNYHAGPQALIGIIRQRFWVIDVRRLAKKVVDGCLHCFKYRPRLLTQIMGNLPADRVQPARPFAKAGVDFCGPFFVTHKLRGQRLLKAYVAVFVCFVVKAVHLEVVSDLTSQGFIAALRRFVARRGLCRELYCDNATNFVGARNELNAFKDQFFKQQIQNEIASWCTGEHIRFHHIPPRAPHFGGLWEAAVKSAKSHLIRTLGGTSLTFEELSTVAADIEAILNSRPICTLSNDPSDEPVLTPGHFLIGGPQVSIAEPLILDEKMSFTKRWRHINQIRQHFWARWSKEYLLELQRRAKWKTSTENVKIGTLALISDDNTIPQQWLVGRIIHTVTSLDGKIRVVDLKTRNGILRRAVHRLAPLPIDS